MTKEVLLSLKGLQFDGMGQEDLTTILPAEYYWKNGKHYVIYEEVAEGYTGATRNVIKFQDHTLDVIKKGEVNVHLLFEENRKNLSNYATPFGEIMVGINTTHMEMTENENQIRLDVSYGLEVNYQHLADCRISLNICPRHESEEIFEKHEMS